MMELTRFKYKYVTATGLLSHSAESTVSNSDYKYIKKMCSHELGLISSRYCNFKSLILFL